MGRDLSPLQRKIFVVNRQNKAETEGINKITHTCTTVFSHTMMKLVVMENIPNPPREKRRMPHLTDEQLRWTLQTRLEKQEELERNGMRNAELWNEISDQFKVRIFAWW